MEQLRFLSGTCRDINNQGTRTALLPIVLSALAVASLVAIDTHWNIGGSMHTWSRSVCFPALKTELSGTVHRWLWWYIARLYTLSLYTMQLLHVLQPAIFWTWTGCCKMSGTRYQPLYQMWALSQLICWSFTHRRWRWRSYVHPKQPCILRTWEPGKSCPTYEEPLFVG